MRALAAFIMAGRAKAALVAFAGSLLPLISPAAVALVALRRGSAEGTLIMLWALLPLLLMQYLGGEVAPAMVWTSAAALPVVLVGAGALGGSVSWPQTLNIVVAASAMAALAMKWLAADDIAALRQAILEVLKQVQPDQTPTFMPTETFVLGMVAWIVALSAIFSLLLARWWQSLLYNPGGFGSEFRALRIQSLWAVAMLVGMVICYLLPQDYLAWGNLLGLPLLLAGVALVHHTATVTQIGGHWLVIFYVAMVVMAGPVTTVLAGLGFLDSTMNLRARLAERRGEK